MYKKMNNNSYEKIMKLIFERPSYRFHIREIARLVGLSPSTILNMLEWLKGRGLVKVEKKRHIVEVFADIENNAFLRKKRVFNISQIYESDIVDFISKKIDAELISVIGSYSRGEDIEKSDIDIVVISSEKNKEIDLSRFEKNLGRKIHLLVLNYNEISDEFYTNLINGVILYGHIKMKEKNERV